PLDQVLSDEATALADRIILDSGAFPDPAPTLHFVAGELRRHHSALVIGDFAWERTREWRQMIAQAFASPNAQQRLQAIRSVTIESSGDHSPAQALLLAGWLASRLGWEHPRDVVNLRVANDGDAAAVRRVHLELGERARGDTVTVESTGSTLRTLSRFGEVEMNRVVAHGQADVPALMSRLLDEARAYSLYAAAVAAAVPLA
ncbi:MAG TPA: glucose-6-phosphate dehydrogenase assembly protein OpcA, partial [Candidatus Dormibacteraeota bacterium]|nr:glucose-6-phosphate dehydrogenase assembly protein OpcA [Candidatus Dormibacteraeota bacterium]